MNDIHYGYDYIFGQLISWRLGRAPANACNRAALHYNQLAYST